MISSAAKAFARQLLISRIAVIALAVVSALYSLHAVKFWWVAPAQFGIGIDPATAIVNELAPRDAGKGIRVGDRVDLSAMPFRERSYLYQNMPKAAGSRMTVRAFHDKQSRTATFETVTLMLSVEDEIFYFSQKVITVLFIITGVILVWSRPSIMLWGLALFLIRTHEYMVGPFVSPAIAALIISGYAILHSLGLPGLIVFAARFPDGRSTNVTRFYDALATAIFVIYTYQLLHDYIPLFTARPIGDLPGDFIRTVFDSGAYVVIFVVLCVKLRRKSRSIRAGFAWIVAGYGIGVVVARIALGNLMDAINFDTFWPLFAQEVLMLALPASVAYSVIRHRTFGLGYLANRTLVYATLTVGAVATVSLGVWLASKQVPTTLGVAAAMVVALLVGMGFQAQQGRIARLVDRIFLPHRYEAAASLDRIRETLRGVDDAKRLAEEVTAALGLASVAVFARTNDGGFVRKAACGWPDGTAWHLLPDETLTRSLDGHGAVIALPDDVGDDVTLPAASARPRVALTLRSSGRVERAIFVGSYRNGANLDRDAIRSLHGVFADAVA